MYYFKLFLLALTFAGIGVTITRFLAYKYEFLIHPQLDRWHKKPVAAHGAFGFYPVFLILLLITTLVYFPENNLKTLASISGIKNTLSIVSCSLILFTFGWLDDLHHFHPLTKFILQIIVTNLFISFSGTFQISDIGFLNYFYTLIWFVGIMNATNLMDCMDGLCAGNIVILLTSLLIILFSMNGIDAELLSIKNIAMILAGSLCGFLIFNLPPASIFMGDSGSLPLGFIIAAITFPSEINGYIGYLDIGSIKLILIPICLLIYPITDTCLVTITRVLNKKKFYIGGKDHSCHRLVLSGFKEKYSLLICYSYSIVGGASAIGIYKYPDLSLVIFSMLITLAIIFTTYLARIDPTKIKQLL